MVDRVIQDDAHVFDWALAQVEADLNEEIDYQELRTEFTRQYVWSGECDSAEFRDV